jgi:hypothetical protein
MTQSDLRRGRSDVGNSCYAYVPSWQAQMRSADCQNYPLLAVNRTYRGHHKTEATDPKQQWRNRLCCLADSPV